MSGDESDLIVATAERIFGDRVDKNVLDAAEHREFPAALHVLLEENGLTRIATPESGATLSDAFRLIDVAGRHAVPLPLAEIVLGHRLAAEAGLDLEGPLTIGVASGEAPGVLADVPWAGESRYVLHLAGRELNVAERSRCEVEPGANLAGEPRDRVRFVGEPRYRVTLTDLDETRLYELLALSRAVLMAGALDALLGMSVRYALERKQFGRPIAGFQAIQHQLAVMAGEVAAARRAADVAVARLGTAHAGVSIAVAKARVGEAAGAAAAIAHQVHGAMGFTYEHRLHHTTRRLWAWRDELGREHEWQARLGRMIASTGADGAWDFITAHG